MRIATYNVNSINARLPVLLRWLEKTTPDVACLQELKATQENFPEEAIREAGYHALWHGQKSWNGVAILARGAAPTEIQRGLPGDEEDTQSRYLEAEVNGITIACLYLPNGNPAPGPKWDYKLAWMERLKTRADTLLATGKPTIILGDFNIIPTEADAYKPERWTEDALFRPESRAVFQTLLDAGWADALRQMHPNDKALYTYWDYFRNAFGRNAGLRIDHCLLSPTLATRLAAAGVDKTVRGWEKTSDHTPAWVDIRDEE